MQRLYLGYLFFACLIGLILTQSVHFPDKGILACLYILAFLMSIHYGRLLQKEYLLAGIYWSAIILALTGVLGWLDIFIHTTAVGIAGIIGQKNLFANWIACGIIAGIWLQKTKFSLMFLIIILLLSGSKTAFLFLLLIIWVGYKQWKV